MLLGFFAIVNTSFQLKKAENTLRYRLTRSQLLEAVLSQLESLYFSEPSTFFALSQTWLGVRNGLKLK